MSWYCFSILLNIVHHPVIAVAKFEYSQELVKPCSRRQGGTAVWNLSEFLFDSMHTECKSVTKAPPLQCDIFKTDPALAACYV